MQNQVHCLKVKFSKVVFILKASITRQFILQNGTRQTVSSWMFTQTTMVKQTGSLSSQMTLLLPKIVALFHTETSFTFMAVRIIRTKYLSLIVMIQKFGPVLSSILSGERVQVTTMIYFSVFQLKISDCVINQKALYLTNGGSGLRS